MGTSFDRQPRVVICGSMRLLCLMNAVAKGLEGNGVQAVTPRRDDCAGPQGKRTASLKHFSEIKHSDTDAVLIVNEHCSDTESYIGPNAFAEAAVAFAEGRRIFVLDGIPVQYSDELTAWGAVNINSDISTMLRELRRGSTSTRRAV